MSDILTRSTSVTAGEGRTIVAPCVVPYNRAARVRDGEGPTYVEMFAPGCFANITRAPYRVLVRAEHAQNHYDIVGRATTFVDSEAGLAGEFVAVEGPFGDHALALIKDGIWTGASVGFVPLSSRRGAAGEIVRVRCHLDHVGLVVTPAYAEASELAVRRRPDLADLRPRRDDGLTKRLTALGVGGYNGSQEGPPPAGP
ncbi:MAG: HK97 family phage prohead protease [Acidimicrobiales bacterium]|nr:HK97 family phage prohead protease [Acidimicrobiales bacterium]